MRIKFATFTASLLLLCSCTTRSQVEDSRNKNRVEIYFLEYASIYEDLIDESYVMTHGMMFTAPIEMAGMFEGQLVENSPESNTAANEQNTRVDDVAGLAQIHSIGTPSEQHDFSRVYVVVRFKDHTLSFTNENGKHGRLDGKGYDFSEETIRWFQRCIHPMWKSTQQLLGEPRARVQTPPLGKNPFRDSK